MANTLLYKSVHDVMISNAMLRKVHKAQTSGRGCVRLSQVSPDVLNNADYELSLCGIPLLVQQLELTFPYFPEQCLQCLKDFISRISSSDDVRLRSAAMVELETTQKLMAALFVEFGGAQVLERIIMTPSLVSDSSVAQDGIQQELTYQALVAFSKLILFMHPRVEKETAEFASHADFISHLFALVGCDKTSVVACDILEDLLIARQSVFSLASVVGLQQSIENFTDTQLANFCRILSVTISDLDVYENKASLYAQNQEKRQKTFINIRDANQEYLLAVPNLLQRLVDIAIKQPYLPLRPRNVSEFDGWLQLIEQSLSSIVNGDMNDSSEMEALSALVQNAPTTSGSSTENAQPAVAMFNALYRRVTMIYVLGLFLAGKYRKKVQKSLAQLGIVSAMNDLMDQFFWGLCSCGSTGQGRAAGHYGCDCCPEIAMKIQFLRLVHSFCDHSSYKHLLLSRSEMNELARINAAAGIHKSGNLQHVDRELLCQGRKGLIVKLTDVLKKEPASSPFRFWLARAIESYLRGSVNYCDQVFFIKRGLLDHVVRTLVEPVEQPVSKELLQSSFDLLGELTKFNMEALTTLDKLLLGFNKMEALFDLVNNNLIDSNMFVRSLLLSLEHFRTVEMENYDYVLKHVELMKHIKNFGSQISYLHKLTNVVNVNTLTQENVSCLNTALVFLMFAERCGELVRYLSTLAMDRGASGFSFVNPVTLSNLYELLSFWQDHYLNKDKDCTALEQSSRINFDNWKRVVSIMLSQDRSRNTSILYYMDSCCQRDS